MATLYLENLNMFSTLYGSANKVIPNKDCTDLFCGHKKTVTPISRTLSHKKKKLLKGVHDK